MLIWSLTTDPYGGPVVTTLHATEADVIASLRENFDPQDELAAVSDNDIYQKLIDDQGVSIYTEQHDISYLLPGLAEVKVLAQQAQNAALNDSNDDEIDALREALEAALTALGLKLPEAGVSLTQALTQSYEDYLSDEPDQYGLPDGLTREQYEALKKALT